MTRESEPGLPRQNNYPAWPDSTGFQDVMGMMDTGGRDSKPILDYFRAIMYRKFTVIGIIVVAVGLAAYYASGVRPLYQSSAIIEIEKVYPTASNISDLFSFFGQFDLYYQTQIESLRSRSLIERFLGKQKAKKASNKNEAEATPEQTELSPQEQLAAERQKAGEIAGVLGRVTINPVRNTQLIQIDMLDGDPLEAKSMLDLYLRSFIEEDQRKRSEISDKVKSWLRNELAETEKQLKTSQANLDEFARKNQIVYAGPIVNPSAGHSDKTGEDLAKSKENRINLELLNQEKNRLMPNGLSEFLQQLKSQSATLKSEYTSDLTRYSPEYFKMGLLKKRIDSLDAQIQELSKDAVSSELETAKKKEERARETYDKLKQEALEANSVSVQYEILKKIFDANEQAYLMLVQKSKQAEMDQGLRGHNISILNPPNLPLVNMSPSKSKILLIGAILGLIGGIAVALGLDFIDGSVHNPRELEKNLSLPILGTVPRIGDSVSPIYSRKPKLYPAPKIATLEFLAHHFPTAPFTDAIRVVQNSASALVQNGATSSICISSALPLEGKTLLAVVMGTVVASENKRVLIIDGDMRRPRIHQVFKKAANGRGLSDLLSGDVADPEEIVHDSGIPGLYFVTSGTPTENPVALLKSDSAIDMINQYKESFDFVILDAPPILGLVDATILSNFSDGLILVAKAGHTPVDILRQAKEAVTRGQGRLLGIVLNMVEPKGGRYGYGYHHYYGYHGGSRPSDTTAS